MRISEAQRLVHDYSRPLKARRLLQPVPEALRLAEAEIGRLGLHLVARQKIILEATERALCQLLAVDGERRVLCNVVGGFLPDHPAPIWQCTSLVEGGDRVLVTCTVHPMPIAPAELAQTLPDATPEILLVAHRRALEALSRRGIHAVEVLDPVSAMSAAHHLLGAAARQDAQRTARALRANVERGRHEGVGAIAVVRGDVLGDD